MPLPSYHILLIEDVDADVVLFQAYMQESDIEHYQIHHRYSLAEGRKVPREFPIDIILLDLQLPDSLGFPTFEKIHAEFPGLPVIVMTGRAESSLGMRCVKAGAQDFLPKKGLTGGLLGRSIQYSIGRNHLKNRLEEAQHLAMIGNWSVDMKTNLMSSSAQMYEIMEVNPSDNPAYSFADYMGLVHKDDQGLVAQHIKSSFESGHEFELDHKLCFEDNKVKHVIMKARTELDVEGNPMTLVGMTQDVTHRVQMDTLKKEKELAKRSDKMRQEFLAKTSHEIRTPLNPILVLTDILLKSNLSPEQKKDLDAIKAAGNTLLAVVNDLLDLSKIEAGKIDFVKNSFSISEVFDYAQDMLEPNAQKKGLKLLINIDPTIPNLIQGDNIRLTQIILNLIGNAIKFTHEGEIRVSAYKEYEKENKIGVSFRVEDTGIGIPKDMLKVIFESFQQIDSDTNRQYGGTGLGLTIVRQLVRLQGGTIDVDSTLGKGSNFMFKLEFEAKNEQEEQVEATEKALVPGLAAEEQEAPKQEAEPVELSLDKLKGYELLLVEDNPLNQMVTKKLLSDWGIDLEIAKNGKEAIDLLKIRGFDLILMDVQMPEMDGYEATRFIRKNMSSPFKEIPIIALTANAFSGSDDECMQAGMDDYVSKPIDINHLYSKISQHVRKWPKEPVVANTSANGHAAEVKVPTLPKPMPESVHSAGTPSNGKVEIPAKEPLLQKNNGVNQELVQKEVEEKHMSTSNIDLSYLREISSNDERIIRKAIEKFLDTTPELLSQMGTQLQGEDHQALGKSAHKLKSSVAFMGIHAVKEKLLKIESVAKTHEGMENLPNLVADTQQIVEDAMEELKMKL